jgi:hypothetical protein
MTHTEVIVTGPWAGAGTWLGEAQRVRLLAAELDVDLDEDLLIYYDVREMMALGLRLQRALGPNGGPFQSLARRASAIPVLRLFRSQDDQFPIRRL